MLTTKDELITFIENNVLIPAEIHPGATDIIRRKVRTTRMRLQELKSAEKVEEFFWNAIASHRGIDSYTHIKKIGANTFEDVRAEFKQLCGRRN